MNTFLNLQSRLDYIDKKIAKLEKVIAASPSGNLICRKKADGSYRYARKMILSDGKTKELYLGKKHKEEIHLLAERMLSERELKDLKKERDLLVPYLDYLQQETNTEKYLRLNPGISNIALSEEEKIREQANKWKYQEYSRNKNFAEHLVYPTVVPGLLVRSKSEADIIARLEYYEVPYHYEENTQIGQYNQAIDLKCLNIYKDQLWYWDHRGQMDNPEYINKVLWCDRQFYDNGIILGKNLIITTETKDSPLDINWVDQLILYFLK